MNVGSLRPGRLRVRFALLVATTALFVLAVLAALIVPPLERNLERSRMQSLAAAMDLTTRKTALTDQLTPDLANGRLSKAGYRSLRRLADEAQARVTLWWGTGGGLRFEADSVLGNADEQPARHPELPPIAFVATATEGRPVMTVGRFDGHPTALVARNLNPYGSPTVLLFSTSLGDVRAQVSSVERRFLVGGVFAFFAALGIGLLAAEPLARRLQRLRRSAEAISHGSFGRPIADRSRDEIGDLARSLEDMRQRLEQLDLARSQFLANASHELRTPLTSIGGYVELLLEGEADEARRHEYLATVHEQVQRLTKLANDLLDLTKLEAGGAEIRRDRIDLADLAAEAVRDAQPLAEAHGSTLRLASGDADAPALGDELRVLQIVRGLIDNAFRHTPEGTTVEVACRATPWGASLVVSDDGPGIPPEVLPRVFERFVRGPGAAAQGSGLGLAIARELADRMGGRLHVESSPAGARFTLELLARRSRAVPVAEVPGLG